MDSRYGSVEHSTDEEYNCLPVRGRFYLGCMADAEPRVLSQRPSSRVSRNASDGGGEGHSEGACALCGSLTRLSELTAPRGWPIAPGLGAHHFRLASIVVGVAGFEPAFPLLDQFPRLVGYRYPTPRLRGYGRGAWCDAGCAQNAHVPPSQYE